MYACKIMTVFFFYESKKYFLTSTRLTANRRVPLVKFKTRVSFLIGKNMVTIATNSASG